MKYRTLGKTGFEVSEIGFGGWAIGGSWGHQREEDSVNALHKALDLGVNFIDTAAGYGNGKSEKIIGKVIKERSEEIYVSTKIPPAQGPWPPSPYCQSNQRYSEAYLRKMVDERLHNLQTDCLDILFLHTWNRAWNRDPEPLFILKQLKREGKIRSIGISTPEDDQDSINNLMREGLIDVVQVIYNIFEQQPVAELFPLALKNEIGVVVRVAFDEGVLTGKYTKDHQFSPDDFRSKYFAGDRLARAVDRVEKIKKDTSSSGLSLPQLALKFALSDPAVSTVIPGIRNIQQAQANTAVSDLPDLTPEIQQKLTQHAWRRGFWYGGK
ncbi:MAG: aldo/keto reductase [Candidatus Cyclobacteriaceae bacterium M3_2C_046]